MSDSVEVQNQSTSTIKSEAGKRELEYVAIEKIDVVENPRSQTDEASFQSLCDSVRRFGVTTPILLARVAGQDRYTVIAGQRRYSAAKEVGLTEVPAQITLPEEAAVGTKRLSRALIENMVREDMTPVDEARAFLALQKSEGLNEKGVAELLSVSERRVRERLELLALPETVQEKVDSKEISLGNAATLKPIAEQSPRVASALASRVVDGSQSRAALDADPAAALRALGDLEIKTGDPDEDLFVLPFGERDSVNLNEIVSRLSRVSLADSLPEEEATQITDKLKQLEELLDEVPDDQAVVAITEAEVDRARAYGALIEYQEGAHKRSGVLTDPVFAADWAIEVAKRDFSQVTADEEETSQKVELESTVDAVAEEKKRRKDERYAAELSNRHLSHKLSTRYDFAEEITMEQAVTFAGLIVDAYGRDLARAVGVVREDFIVTEESRSMKAQRKQVTTRLPGPDEALEKVEELLAKATTPEQLLSRLFGLLAAAVFADRRAVPESRRGGQFPLPLSSGAQKTIGSQVRGALWDSICPMLTKERAEELEESFDPSDEGRPTRDRLARNDDIGLESAAPEQSLVDIDDLEIAEIDDLDLDEDDSLESSAV